MDDTAAPADGHRRRDMDRCMRCRSRVAAGATRCVACGAGIGGGGGAPPTGSSAATLFVRAARPFVAAWLWLLPSRRPQTDEAPDPAPEPRTPDAPTPANVPDAEPAVRRPEPALDADAASPLPEAERFSPAFLTLLASLRQTDEERRAEMQRPTGVRRLTPQEVEARRLEETRHATEFRSRNIAEY